jgi:hypothetical protein
MIFGVVIFAWLLGAGLGFVTQRPHAVAASNTPSPSLTTTPATTTTPSTTATP